jgi:hypothetical protein
VCLNDKLELNSSDSPSPAAHSICYYKLIVLDAFSFDTVPVHLLSREALKLYRDKLAEKGLLVLNLSNWYLDLDPVIGRQASDGGPACRVRYDLHVSDKERRLG